MHPSPDGRTPGWKSWRRGWRNGQTIRLGGCAFGGVPKRRRARFCQQLRPLPTPRRTSNLRPTILRRARLQLSRGGGRGRRSCPCLAPRGPTSTWRLPAQLLGQLAEHCEAQSNTACHSPTSISGEKKRSSSGELELRCLFSEYRLIAVRNPFKKSLG